MSQALPYSDPFCEDQYISSDSYSSSPAERHRSDFQFALGAPVASPYKSSELPMVYLNKGQFYPITLQGIDSSANLTTSKVKVSSRFVLRYEDYKHLTRFITLFDKTEKKIHVACS